MPNVVADQMCFLQGDDGKIFLNKKIAEFAIILELNGYSLNGYSDCLKIG